MTQNGNQERHSANRVIEKRHQETKEKTICNTRKIERETERQHWKFKLVTPRTLISAVAVPPL